MVLMIHGSGPLDRNENMKGQSLDVFNTIAHTLVKSGIASFRYDKRGCGLSTGDYYDSGHDDFVVDAKTCLDALIKDENISARDIFLLGHSEGCIIAPQVCSQRQSVAGMVLLCPCIEPIESMMLRQAEQLEKEINEIPGVSGHVYRFISRVTGRPLASQKRLIQKVNSTSSSVIRLGFRRFPAKWLRELMAIDLKAIFGTIIHPMLLIGGQKDLQCSPEDVFRIAKIAQGATETRVIEDLTHVLRCDERAASITGQAQLLSKPLEQTVLDLIGTWINNQREARNGMQPARRRWSLIRQSS